MARNTGSDDLYKLIHTLNKEEKGYFKKFAARHSEQNVYLQLFDAITGQDKFEEASLQKKFKNYTVIKVYLYESILQSLMIYKKEKDIELDLHYQYIYISILLEKKQLVKARQLAKRAAQKAAAAEVFTMHYLFLRILHMIDKNTWRTKNFIKNTQAHFATTQKLFAEAINAEKYREADALLFFFDMVELKVGEDFGRIEDVVDIPSLKSAQGAHTRTSERHRLAGLARYYSLINREDERCVVFEKLFQFENKLAKEKSLLANNRIRTLALWGIVSAYLETHQFKKAEKTLDTEWTEKYGKHSGLEWWYYVYMKCTVYWAIGKHKEGTHFIEQHFGGLDFNLGEDKAMNVLAEITKLRALFAYSTNQYKNAFLYLNELQADGLRKHAPIYYKDAEILKVLIQVKTSNYDALQQLAGNLLRQAKAYGVSMLEKDVLKVLKEMNGDNNRKIFATLTSLTSTVADKPNLLGVLLWKNIVENIISNKPISEMNPFG